MNWHFYSLSTDKLQSMIAAQYGKIGDPIPALEVFRCNIKTAYIRYWESRLTSLHRIAITRSRYAQLIELVIKAHNETFKLYSGIEATLGQRAKLLREILNDSATSNVADILASCANRLSNCDRQAMAIIQRAAVLQDMVSWIRNNHAPGSSIMELAEEYERVVLLGKLTGGEILTSCADYAVAISRFKVLF